MYDRYERFERDAWAARRQATPMLLTAEDLDRIRGINERIDLEEVGNIYLPLSRLLNLHITATQGLTAVTDTFLGTAPEPIPYVIGLGGSVAVGKSTSARVLQELLRNWPSHPRVELITTDGFLWPNAELESRGLMDRKGFPESYDTATLVSVLDAVKSGEPSVQAPVYSHLRYDIVPDRFVTIERPDVLIVEGLNVLQPNPGIDRLFVSDFFDFSIYIDADSEAIKQWYVERFMALRDSVFTNPDSYFRHYADLHPEAAIETAAKIWDHINGPNLEQNIEPTKYRADCILTKLADHSVDTVQLRKR